MRIVRFLYRILIIGGILLSIIMNYYVHIVKKEHAIFTYTEGPDTSDYLEEGI